MKNWEVITERDIIRSVPVRWRNQYRHQDGTWTRTMCGDSEEVYNALIALDLNTATAEDVARIIGNTSWVDTRCDGCKEWVSAFALFDVEGEYPFHLCSTCLVRAGGDVLEALNADRC